MSIENVDAITFIKIHFIRIEVDVSTRSHSNKSTFGRRMIHSHTVVHCLRSVPERKEGKLFILFCSFPRAYM